MNVRSRSLWLCVVLHGCGTRSIELAGSARLDASVPDAREPTFHLDDASVVLCGSTPCACSDGVDNDLDGFVDGFDAECTGAFDQFEDSFATGSHGEDSTSKCQDCFFDGNSGAGDDGCKRARACTTDPGASGIGACRDCSVDATCTGSCAPLVPNGCDCFGCCGVWRDGVELTILLGSASCTLATLDDTQRCTPCTRSAQCGNPCSECELCPGRTVRDLPDSCAGSGPGFICSDGETCERPSDCPTLAYCQQGCCTQVGL